ncbi:MAG: hypothetical protein KGQ83_11125, partial [Planctomycetes bacterium]|nr:hypothetical protein [Planctomycetota bacterium]
HTCYAHMYGLISGLVKTNSPVYITEYKTIHIREQRAGEGVDVSKYLTKYWIEYIKWLKDFINLPNLEIDAALRYPISYKTRAAQFILSKMKSILRIILPKTVIEILKQYKERFLIGKKKNRRNA